MHRSKLHLSIQLEGDIGRNIGKPEQDTRGQFQFQRFGFLLVLSLLAFLLLRYGALGFLSEVDVDEAPADEKRLRKSASLGFRAATVDFQCVDVREPTVTDLRCLKPLRIAA